MVHSRERGWARSSIAAAAALLLLGCVERYTVEVQNSWGDESIEVGIAQFHSERFDGTPPTSFSDELIVHELRVRLAPHERKVVEFNGASGGFWLRWRLLSPPLESTHEHTVSLINGERTINVAK